MLRVWHSMSFSEMPGHCFHSARRLLLGNKHDWITEARTRRLQTVTDKSPANMPQLDTYCNAELDLSFRFGWSPRRTAEDNWGLRAVFHRRQPSTEVAKRHSAWTRCPTFGLCPSS